MNNKADHAMRTLLLCFLTALCEGIDLQAAGVAAAGIVSVHHPSPSQLGIFFSASTTGLVLGALIGGRLADDFGRKRMLVVAIVVFGLFSLLTPLAWDMPSLSWARLFTGFGLGGAMPNLIALVSESAPEARRNAYVAAAYSAMPAGGVIVSLLNLSLSPAQWPLIFIVGGVVPLLLAPILMLALQESAAFLQAVAQRTVSINRAVPQPDPVKFSSLFAEGRASRTVLLWVGFFLALIILYLLLNWLPILLTRSGLTPVQASLAQAGFNGGGVLAALLTGRLLEGKWRNATIVTVFIVLPLLLLALAHSPAQVTAIVTIVFLLGCAVLAGQAFFFTAAASSYPTAIRGMGVGSAIAAGRLGAVVGPLLGGALTASGLGPAALLLKIVPLAVVGSVLALVLARRVER